MKKLEDFLKDGMTIGISGIDSSFYPKRLIKKIVDSEVKDLTLFYIEDNTDLDPNGDPMQLVYNGQVKKLIVSHLGKLSKTFSEFVEEIELIPMDVLVFKMQAGANRIPGIAIDYDYATLYRDEDFLQKNSFVNEGKKYCFESALNGDINIVSVDFIDPITKHCKMEGTSFNSIDLARSGKLCFIEADFSKTLTFNDVDIPGQYVDGFIVNNAKYEKTNW